MKKIRAALALVLCLAAGLSGCTAETGESRSLEKYEDSFFQAFDSTIVLTAYCESQEEFTELFDEVKTEYLRYHKLFDIYFSYSGVNNAKTVNDNAGLAPVEVDGELIELLDFGREMYRLTDGDVNIAFGSVLSLWHDVRDYNSVPGVEKKLPDMAELEAAAEHCDIEKMEIDKAAGSVYLADPLMSLDLGAIAKGFATEKVARKLEAEGRRYITINAGGNVRSLGTKPNGEKWNVAVTNPDLSSSTPYIDLVSVESSAVVTSGVYQRFFEYEGRRYHHIIDPATLMPEQRYLSVTIVAADSAYADALSTAVFNMEPEEGYAFIDSLDGVEALWVMYDGSVAASARFH